MDESWKGKDVGGRGLGKMTMMELRIRVDDGVHNGDADDSAVMQCEALTWMPGRKLQDRDQD